MRPSKQSGRQQEGAQRRGCSYRLIQIAAAHLKWLQGFHDVAMRMAAAGLEKMKHINGIFLGIDVATFRYAVKSYFSDGTEMPVRIELIKD
jgi:hypothetical protein